MSSIKSAYTSFSALLLDSNISISPAEIQGFLLGYISGKGTFKDDGWTSAITDILGFVPNQKIYKAFQGIIDLFKKEVKENSVTAILMLPPDDDAIDKRLQAECDWCQGFLSGFGIACGKDKVSSSIKEILEDVVEISQLQVTTEESEEIEVYYTELFEYLKIVPILLITERERDQKLKKRKVIH